MVEEPVCAAETEDEILAQWETDGAMEIVDDVDRDAFREMAEPYLRENFTPEQVESWTPSAPPRSSIGTRCPGTQPRAPSPTRHLTRW